MRNLLFRNRGNGRFAETSKEGGPAFARAEVGRGAAFGDLDNDGDIDIVVSNNNGPARLLRNRAGNTRAWLQVRLFSDGPNRDGFGALVRVDRAGHPPQSRRVRTDGSYLAAQDPTLHFGLGDHDGPISVTVRWLGGGEERWTIGKVRQRVTLERGTGTLVTR
jgi:hypothetical protein